MMLIQAIALPIIARREVMHPSSSSQALGRLISATPRLSNAILMSEPDFLMEALPYYVPNPVYMPRQPNVAMIIPSALPASPGVQ